MKEKIIKKLPFLIKVSRNIKLIKKLENEYKIFKNNWMYSKETKEKIGYEILLEGHAIEKGMTNKKPRNFGISKVKIIICNIKKYETNNWSEDFAYNFGISILNEYCKFYEKHNWQNKEEYILCKKFILNKKYNVNSGTTEILKQDFIKDATIDYENFLASRHSFREFDKKTIDINDIKKAVNITRNTPSACNRQMCKVYFVKSKNIESQIINYSHGLTNFNNDTINILVITYDIASLCHPGEITQGMFNAGLFSMNLVNALHSLSIGSCFLEYNNTKKEENEMKKILNIPKNEKIAVVIAAGYYPEKSVITKSPRKEISEILYEV